MSLELDLELNFSDSLLIQAYRANDVCRSVCVCKLLICVNIQRNIHILYNHPPDGREHHQQKQENSQSGNGNEGMCHTFCQVLGQIPPSAVCLCVCVIVMVLAVPVICVYMLVRTCVCMSVLVC